MTTKRWPKSFPKLPATVEGSGGPIRVRLVKSPQDYDDDDHDPKKAKCWGTYSACVRLIEIARDTDPRFQWHTFYHEWTHSALMDSGASSRLGKRKEEALCEAIATARMRERFG